MLLVGTPLCACLCYCSAFGIFPAEALNYDFARYFVLVVLANFVIYLIYYLVAKCISKECRTLIIIKPIVYAAIALLTWIASIWFFNQVSICITLE